MTTNNIETKNVLTVEELIKRFEIAKNFENVESFTFTVPDLYTNIEKRFITTVESMTLGKLFSQYIKKNPQIGIVDCNIKVDDREQYKYTK